jgi:ribosomal-protein-alanine N-acetyltransferase
MDIGKLFRESPIFETDRLILRRLAIADAEDYFAFASSPVVTAQTTWDIHRSLDDTVNYLNKVLRRYEEQTEYHWGIVLKETNRLIGRTGLISIDPVHDKAELGYVISDAWWNRGITTEATLPVLRYAFAELGANRIEARCNKDNVGSYRVMEKLGLTFEGILRKQLKIKGSYTDQRMYAMLRDEYFLKYGRS